MYFFNGTFLDPPVFECALQSIKMAVLLLMPCVPYAVTECHCSALVLFFPLYPT